MNFTFRRKPLALFFCYGFASVLAGSYAVEARAQALVSLRVDPALLGLPPITPATAPTPAPVATPVNRPTPAEPVNVEVKPVEAPVVEAQPVVVEPEAIKPVKASKPSEPTKASAQEIPARTVTPHAEPSVVKPLPTPLAPRVASPVVAIPARNPHEEEKTAATVAPERQTAKQPESLLSAPVPAPVSVVPPPAARTVAQQPAQVVYTPASFSTAVSSLAPLRVDPALLGQPHSSVVIAPSQGPVVSAATGQAQLVIPSSPRSQGAVASSAQKKSSQANKSWWEYVWDPLVNVYDNGSLELYLPFETYHSRDTYTQEQIDSYQEKPLGFGIGRGLYNEKGNWEGIFAMGFQDSHFKPSYTAGYEWKATWRPVEDVRLGLGYLAGLMSREDVANYVPFPIVFPVASVGYKNFSIEGTYIPPVGGKGNVMFLWAKWELGKTGETIGTPAHPAPPPANEMVNTSFGLATPLANQRVPYGPALDTRSGIVSTAQTKPPIVPATGPRDEEEVPDVTPALALRSSKAMEPLPKNSTVPRPVFLSALRMGGEIEREFVAEEDAELRKIGTVLNADRLTYWPIDDEVEAEGNVRLEQGEDLVTGPKMRMKLEDQVGFFEQPSYRIKRQPQPGSQTAADKAYAARFGEQQSKGDDYWNSGFASPRVLDIKPGQTTFKDSYDMGGPKTTEARGDAERIDFEGENQIRLTNGTYTTCAPGNDDWYAKANNLQLDYDREVANGTDGTVYFMDVPILYSPWLSFSLNNERKSGFLAPTFATNSDSGVELSLPYYWNIAPNMDATITPRIMTKRGVMLSNEFRYLNTGYEGLYRGQATADILPSDNARDGEKRYGFSLNHSQTTAIGLSGAINYSKVSDNNYFTDLSSNVSQTSQVNLLQQGVLSYGGSWWNATANYQQYQTLQPDPSNPNLYPYELVPQITVNARKPDLFMTDSSFFGQYTSFKINEHLQNGTIYPDGQRTVLYPQVALPYVTPGWYVTPKLGVNIRNYTLTRQAAGAPDSISVTLPIASVDSGMTFERTSNWYGQDYTQTLEPRLFYVNIPYKNQDQIPIFDTAQSDFNFAQIFSENQFSGWDRINNANQLTAAVTTRLLEPSSGNEIARAMFGQRFYFTRNKVELNRGINTSSENDAWEKSDILAAFSGQILPKVFADSAVEYNLANRQVKQFSLGGRYQPEPGKVLNASYRYNNDPNAPIDQVDFSGQWPLSGRWFAVGRLNYSFHDDGAVNSTTTQGGRMIQSIAGLEYNGGCWVVRGVFQRLALTQDNTTTSFFLQLELNDFSRIGTNPLNLLKRNIEGYNTINQPAAESVLGN